MSAKIWVMCHKKVDYEIPDNELYTPIQAGAAINEPIYKDRDDYGDNISEWNPLYAETTCLYNIWKNRLGDYDFVGNNQYRRQFSFPTDYEFKKGTAYAAAPMALIPTVYEQYCRCHSKSDMEMLECIISDKYPEYLEDFNTFIKHGHLLLYSNGFVLEREKYDEYCTFLFGILAEFKERMGWNDIKDVLAYVRKQIDKRQRNKARGVRYQMQIFGFLSERIFTLWLMHNYGNNIVVQKYKLMENGMTI